jgi:hypothetical protein
MSDRANPNQRTKGADTIKIFHRDVNTLQTWAPELAPLNPFLTVIAKYHMVEDNLNWEKKEKYVNRYQA